MHWIAELLHTFHDTAFQAFVDAKPDRSVSRKFDEYNVGVTLHPGCWLVTTRITGRGIVSEQDKNLE